MNPMDVMIEIEKQYRDVTLELAKNDPLILKLAVSIAYYTAMLDAATCDPLDDPTEQQETLARYTEKIAAYTEQFQAVVNEKL